MGNPAELAHPADAPVGHFFSDRQRAGLRLVVRRGPSSLTAYVGVPDGHPLAGFEYEALVGVEPHGGLTFAGAFARVPGWWFYGWDYAHLGDRPFYPRGVDDDDHDWTVAEVIAQLDDVAGDFARLARLIERVVERCG